MAAALARGMITAIDVLRSDFTVVYAAVDSEGRIISVVSGADERGCLETLRQASGPDLRVVPRLAPAGRWLGLKPGRLTPRGLEAARVAAWVHLSGAPFDREVSVLVLRAFLRNAGAAWGPQLWARADVRRLPISSFHAHPTGEYEHHYLATVVGPSLFDGGRIEVTREDGFSYVVTFSQDRPVLAPLLRRFGLDAQPAPARIDDAPLDTDDLLTLGAVLDILAQMAERGVDDETNLIGATLGIDDHYVSASAWLGERQPDWVQ